MVNKAITDLQVLLEKGLGSPVRNLLVGPVLRLMALISIDASDLICRQLGWEAATERFIEAAEIKPQQWPSLPAELAEGTLWGIYRTFTGKTLHISPLNIT